MKAKFIIYAIAALAVTFGFLGCEESDGDKEYGFGKVYMPQATRGDYYSVPSGGGEYTYNFNVENGKLNVFLGVLRAGKIANAAYSVTVGIDQTAAQTFISKGTVANAMLMPSSIYTIPTSVSVPADKSGETFYLSIDVATLQQAAYDNKQLVLCVNISNPTKFEIADDNTNTMVVINVNAIRGHF